MFYYLDDPTRSPEHFKWEHYKPGSTLCILNAKTHGFRDGQVGIREENTKNSFVFPVTRKNLILQVEKLIAPKTCSGCGETEKTLKACGKCRKSFYCNKDCQKSHWTEGHNKLCKLTEKLNMLIGDE